eukprot:FR737417.1.p1 GENE.FR737417.1~~FR737417.1.p1  ORF type:complete len:380 (+),score=42.96 FR737417.1:36-1142(+)
MRVVEIRESDLKVIPAPPRSASNSFDRIWTPVKASAEEQWITYEHSAAPSHELLETANSNLRCIEWSNITLDLMMSSTGSKATNELSRFVKPGEAIDYFLSHSWHDDPIAKYDKLCEMVNVYKMKNGGREPTFWLDKVCIDQANISDGLKVLPINVMACKQMLVLCGPTYPQRLWCAWELCTLFSFMREEQAIERVELLSLSASDIMEELTKFDVRNAHCYDPNEEAKLRTVIHAVGQAQFNKRIRNLAKACVRNASRRTRIVGSKRSTVQVPAGVLFSDWVTFIPQATKRGALPPLPVALLSAGLNSAEGEPSAAWSNLGPLQLPGAVAPENPRSAPKFLESQIRETYSRNGGFPPPFPFPPPGGES